MLGTQVMWVRSLGQEIPWRRKWQPTPVFLTGKSHEQRSLAGHSPWGGKESDTTERLNNNQGFVWLYCHSFLDSLHLKLKLGCIWSPPPTSNILSLSGLGIGMQSEFLTGPEQAVLTSSETQPCPQTSPSYTPKCSVTMPWLPDTEEPEVGISRYLVLSLISLSALRSRAEHKSCTWRQKDKR